MAPFKLLITHSHSNPLYLTISTHRFSKMAEQAPPAEAAVPPVSAPQPVPTEPAPAAIAAAPAAPAPAPTPAPASAAPAPARELKVEDALLYLDQVKHEFGDRPRIYNEVRAGAKRQQHILSLSSRQEPLARRYAPRRILYISP